MLAEPYSFAIFFLFEDFSLLLNCFELMRGIDGL